MSTTTPEALGLKGPSELYFDWERAHWAAQDIELARDGADWAGLDAGERDLLYARRRWTS